MIIPRHYENPEILHENTMPNRAYCIPASEPLADPRKQIDTPNLCW